jgi:hypothetical protein
VRADAEFDSERNHQHVRTVLGAQSVILAKRGKATWRRCSVRAEMPRAIPRALYGQRALVECVFSAATRPRSARAPGRTLVTQQRQAILLGRAYNIYRGVPTTAM